MHNDVEQFLGVTRRPTVVVAQFTRPSDTNIYGVGDVVCNSTSAPVVLTFRELYYFTISTTTTEPTVGAVYTASTGNTFEVINTAFVAKAGLMTCIRLTGTASINTPSKLTLEKASGTGDAVVTLTRPPYGGSLPLITDNGRTLLQTAKIMKSGAVTTAASFRLYLYRVAPTAINDNAAHTLLWAQRDILQGYVDFTMETSGSGSDACIDVGTFLNVKLEGGAYNNNIYGVLVAKDTYTPASGEKFYLELTIEQTC